MSYQAKNPEKQKKIDELVWVREAYRRQRRIWLWLMAVSFLSYSILLNRSGNLALIFAFICLAMGLFLVWNFIKCNRAVRMIDKGIAPYKVKENRPKT
ncbi:MAG: hypothetical protein V3W19_13760 [Desulfatiglandales bacterium]